nr:hypothetical protein 17 [bacterium]
MFNIQRLKEPSTYAGLAILLSSFGIQITDEMTQAGSMALAGLAGLIAIFLPEKGKK